MNQTLTRGKYYQNHAFVCPAYDGRQSSPAVLQYYRYVYCRKIFRKRRSGSSWIRLYADDLFNVHSSRTEYGKWCFVSICFEKRRRPFKNRHLFILSFYCFITILINILVFAGMDFLLVFLNIPAEIHEMMRQYLWIIFWGLAAVFFLIIILLPCSVPSAILFLCCFW